MIHARRPRTTAYGSRRRRRWRASPRASPPPRASPAAPPERQRRRRATLRAAPQGLWEPTARRTRGLNSIDLGLSAPNLRDLRAVKGEVKHQPCPVEDKANDGAGKPARINRASRPDGYDSDRRIN